MSSLFTVDSLRVYRGRDLAINDKIRIRQPTLGEIEGGDGDESEGNEHRFFQAVYTILATPTDMMAQLDQCGINYEELTNYQLFLYLFPQMEQEETKLLLGDLNPKRFQRELVSNEGRYVLADRENDIYIDEVVYGAMVNYICTFMQVEQTRFIKNGNAFTRDVRMELAYEELEAAKNKPYESMLRPLISTMVNMEGFKSGWDDVWDMKIGAFMDGVKRIQTIISARALLDGCYGGNIDISKIDQKELNYLKKLT